MSAESEQVAIKQPGAVIYDPEWATLRLTWVDETCSTNDDESKATLQPPAEHELKVRDEHLIIDATRFDHRFGQGTLQSCDKHTASLHADRDREARLSGEEWHGCGRHGRNQRGAGAEAPAEFPTGWFETTEHTYWALTA